MSAARWRGAWALAAALWPSAASAQPPPVTPPTEETPRGPAEQKQALPGGWSAALVGAAQLRITDEIQEGVSEGGEPRIEFRRLRVGMRLRDTGGRTLVQVVTNLNAASPELVDAFVEHRTGALRFTVGQMKLPFTGYRIGPFTDLLSTDWPLVTRVFGAGRQLGGMVSHDAPGDGWFGSFGVFQGTQLRPAHDQGITLFYGEATTSYTDFRRGATLDPMHPELALRLGHRWPLDPRGDHLLLGLNARHDLDPVSARDLRDVGALEGELKLGRIQALAIGYGGLARLTQREETAAVTGFFLQLGVHLPWHLTPSAGVAQVAWSPAFQDDARARGLGLIAAAPEKDRAAVQKAHGADGTLAGERSWTATLRWDPDPHLAFWLEGQRSEELRRGADLQVYRLRLQGQVLF